MNETEKKVVARAANGLALMALGLRNGDFMSATDIASALDDRIEQLRGLLKATSERREPGEDLNAESQSRREAEPNVERGRIGVKSCNKCALAFNFSDDLDILVMASMLKPGLWQLRLEKDGDLRMTAMLFGGRATATCLCKYLRNGMTARAYKLRRNPNRRKTEGSRAESQGRREAEGK